MNEQEQADYDSLMSDAKSIRAQISELEDEISDLEGQEWQLHQSAAAIRNDAEKRESAERQEIEEGLRELSCTTAPAIGAKKL